MINKQLEKLIRECIVEVLLESDVEPAAKMKSEIYSKLIPLGFRQFGSTPREYVELYLNGFATVQVVVDAWDNTVRVERFYDSEYLSRKNKTITSKLPTVYSEEFVNSIVELANKWVASIKSDEPIYGGMDDDLEEGFDPQSQGPNPTQENPYPAWNSKMRQM